jgi:peroxiredoxin
MKKVLALALGLLMSAALFAQEEDLDAKYATDLLKPGTPAPEFVLNDINGNTVKLSQFRGKTVVLIFWASWCPDCRAEVPALKELQAKTDAGEVVFVSISSDRTVEAWKKYVAENELGGVQLYRDKSKVSEDYHVKWIPSQYVIGPDGKVVLGTVVLDKVANVLK